MDFCFVIIYVSKSIIPKKGSAGGEFPAGASFFDLRFCKI